jgi:hypothetical protein
MSDTSPSPKPLPRRNKVDKSLQYRWGIVGFILAAAFFGWYITTSGENRNPNKSAATSNLEKIVCPRCNNEPGKKEKCSLCGGLGLIWVNLDVDPGPRGRQPR